MNQPFTTGFDQDLAQSLSVALANTHRVLMARLNPQGHWEGHLSSSALSTAVAITALSWMDHQAHATAIQNGLAWLAQNQNADGAWGDTPCSPSNPSTTLLCWAAFNRSPEALQRHAATLTRAEAWLQQRLGNLDADHIAQRVIASYGKDRTFSVPILTLCALCGRLGKPPQAWANIPQLPFELAALPHSIFKWLQLPVVSYAIPALIAIGLVRHENTAGQIHLLRPLRKALKPRVLEVLKGIQPSTGGFLEAIPLTGFVVMALAASGLKDHPVAELGTQFLKNAQRNDGSWPIDINLSTWVTTLAANSLAVAQPNEFSARERRTKNEEPRTTALDAGQKQTLTRWLLDQQHRVEHPFTHAAPGGWAWTDLPGGVPDADDTAGALLVLHHLDATSETTRKAVIRGIEWLLDLQNRDGGIPTFCRGWMNLPFDRSCPDITAHVLAAWSTWQTHLPAPLQHRLSRAIQRAVGYLQTHQQPDGTWIPLWFGNQQSPKQENPLYGTARVLLALHQLSDSLRVSLAPAIAKAQTWLEKSQQTNGGWGGTPDAPASVEETALALDALGTLQQPNLAVMQNGLRWLLQATKSGTHFPTTPIGLYFATLWYAEDLYPIIFTSSALGRLA